MRPRKSQCFRAGSPNLRCATGTRELARGPGARKSGPAAREKTVRPTVFIHTNHKQIVDAVEYASLSSILLGT